LGLASGGSSLLCVHGTFHELSSWYIKTGQSEEYATHLLCTCLALLVGNWFYKKLGLALGYALSCSGLGGAIFNPIDANKVIVEYGWRVGYEFFRRSRFCLVMP
jgi:hypothetical protein